MTQPVEDKEVTVQPESQIRPEDSPPHEDCEDIAWLNSRRAGVLRAIGDWEARQSSVNPGKPR